jgi:rubredoxin/hemerythrin-like domain-containing protein
MKEHRLIEEMVQGVQLELSREKEQKTVNFPFLETAIDFFRTYADRTHHGKEENILFRDLAKKPLSAEHAKTMQELIQEHIYARKTVTELEAAKGAFAQGNAESLEEIENILQKLAVFYPKHIEKEDKQFFYPTMAYFTAAEQEKMMQEFYEFDRELIHEKYQTITENALSTVRQGDLTKWKCTVCDYIYDPQKGDPKRGIRPGTAFKELPEDWRCPVCLAPKASFKELK